MKLDIERSTAQGIEGYKYRINGRLKISNKNHEFCIGFIKNNRLI